MSEARVDLQRLGQDIVARQVEWDALALEWRISPVKDNFGKPVVTADGESPTHLASIIAWVSGELDLDVARKGDALIVAKHYDLAGDAEFDGVLVEVLRFVRDGVEPSNGIVSVLP